MKKPAIKIEDLYRLKLVGDPQISPDADQVAFMVESMDKKDKTYYQNLWQVSSSGKNCRALTVGKRHDRLPRWAPDGRKLAFAGRRDVGDKKAPSDQIWLLSMAGGEARPLTRLPRGSISQMEWSPDGKFLAILFHPLGSEVKLDDDGKPEIPTSRRIKNIWFRLDGEGFFDSQRTHLWLVNARTGKARQLVDGDFPDTSFCWSPDSRRLAFISFRHADWEKRLEEQEIYTIDIAGDGSITTIKAPKGPKEGLAYSPDGSRLAYFGHQRPYEGWGAVGYLLNVIDAAGRNHRSFGADLDRTAIALTLGDITPSFTFEPPRWSQAGDKIYYRISRNGGQPLVVTDINNDATDFVTPEELVTINGSFDQQQAVHAFHGADLSHPDEICLLTMKTGKIRQLTKLNRSYVNSRDFKVAEEINFENNGQSLQGWVVKPQDFDLGNKYPLIMQIHGGPRGQYGRTFFHEMQALAAAGYVVVYTNPRGSQGYGEEFAASIAACWAEPTMADIMAAVDFLLEQGYIDEKRLGVTGGSYGGYMTNWIVTHTDRFKAACTQRCVSDLSSMFGNSDIGWDLALEFDGPPWKNREVYQKWSPITYIENCHTPLLIVHSENDLRCNVEQGDQMFTALKYLGRDVEYLRFPEEFHGLSRHGRPDRRVDRLQAIVDWFDKYLKN